MILMFFILLVNKKAQTVEFLQFFVDPGRAGFPPP
jgi:hypothetical protein